MNLFNLNLKQLNYQPLYNENKFGDIEDKDKDEEENQYNYKKKNFNRFINKIKFMNINLKFILFLLFLAFYFLISLLMEIPFFYQLNSKNIILYIV